MQPFDTEDGYLAPERVAPQSIDAGRADDLPAGTSKTLELSDGRELGLYNIDGEFYATENFCPHRGARLAEGTLCGHVIECELHGWQFDVRTGKCLTVTERIETYEVVVEDGRVKISA